MMSLKKSDGGPAFPELETDVSNADYPRTYSISGMTLRDYFAAQYIAGRAAREEGLNDFGEASQSAYVIADAMLLEREKLPEPEKA